MDTGDRGSVSSDEMSVSTKCLLLVMGVCGRGSKGGPPESALKQLLEGGGVGSMPQARFQLDTQTSSTIGSSIRSGGGGGRMLEISLRASSLISRSQSDEDASGWSFRKLR